MRALHLVPWPAVHSTPSLHSDEQALSDAPSHVPAVLLAALYNLTMCSLPHPTLDMPTLMLNSELFCGLSWLSQCIRRTCRTLLEPWHVSSALLLEPSSASSRRKECVG